uniref:hypothetical protein n=1 Tax=Amycolatopsis sp. CA-096443 TaxID=3239919 RepID=UPI003F4979AF
MTNDNPRTVRIGEWGKGLYEFCNTASIRDFVENMYGPDNQDLDIVVNNFRDVLNRYLRNTGIELQTDDVFVSTLPVISCPDVAISGAIIELGSGFLDGKFRPGTS